MKSWKQILVSLVLVAAAIAVVIPQLNDGEAAQGSATMEGHDHAAMTAGREMQPVRLDREAARRIGVTMTTVEYRSLEFDVEAMGTVSYDETRLAAVSPKIDGWVEVLHVDFTGAPVERGQALLDLYSPMLVTAQEELVLAARLAAAAPEGRARDNALGLLESARRRLAYWDISEDEIREVEESGVVRKTLTLRAPASGIVVEKNVVAGDRIMPGMTVYRIADLSTVWVEAEVYEKDLGLVAVGQATTTAFEAYPDRTFSARVSYIYPSVSMESRTARIRLELSNPGVALMPGMYARVHLEVPAGAPTLVVPRSAVLATGERALVFVEDADGTLVPRDVTPGRTAGREMEILAGLTVGERVVSSAAFLVDAESNLGALTSGMAAEGDEAEGDEAEGDEAEAMSHEGHDMGSMTVEPAPAAPDTMTGHEGHGGH